jgi:hypothetical protein
MIKTITIFITLIFAAFHGNCQIDSLNFGPEPVGGINKLALVYYKIDFTKEQRKALQDKEIEFIYLIDPAGHATLEEINGVVEKAILDSLQQATSRLPRFYPRRVNGIAESFQQAASYQETAYEDFAYIHKSGARLDILFGGVANGFLGSPGKYLGPGGGMKIEIMGIGKKGIGGGLLMSFYGNKLRQNYPIDSDRAQNSAPPTMLVGFGLNKALVKKERREFNAQVEFNYAIQNITASLGENDKDWTQLKGFSPGLVGNYLIQVGKNKTAYYYGSPSIFCHYLNIHGAVRPVFFNLKEARGVMLELGLSYRLGTHFVDEYRLKP